MDLIKEIIMCLILDANCYSDYVNNTPDMSPVRKWIEKGGGIAYTDSDKFQNELNMVSDMNALMTRYRRTGKAVRFPADKVIQEVKNMENRENKLKSDDEHIIALALVSNARLLVSRDQNLQQDFKNEIQGGKIYQRNTKAHIALLQKTKCKAMQQ